MGAEEKKTEKDLMAFVGGPRPDGSRVGIRRTGDEVQVGLLIPVKEGMLITESEIVSVSPPASGPWCEVETLYDGRPKAGGRPAMVNSKGFRSGWDAVFGGDESQLN